MSTSSFASQVRLASRLILVLAVLGICARAVSTKGPRFYPDDPIAREPESQDASKALPYDIGSIYEITANLFVTAGYKPSGTRAQNINTIDEVPDSSWFTNRIGSTRVSVDEIVRGPIHGAAPDPSRCVLIREKTSGAHPGFTARDAKGDTFFLEFDPPWAPEAATGAVEVATKIFWALGYNQVESYLTTFDMKRVEIDPKATIRRPSGARTRFTHDDINAILEQVARNADGTDRVVAGRLIPGKILGGYLYDGTRPDDPNDVVPHEHRRELRALRVFGAWTNLTDLKAKNALDALVTENGRSIVKHIEGDRFDPRQWRPQSPTTAYLELRDDDAFWAARRVAAFTDEMIRAAVHTGQYSDPKAEQYLGDVLIKRRDKITSTYLTAVNPIVAPRLDANSRLTFENAAVAAGVASGPATYRASWSRFDNATGETQALSDTHSPTTTIEAPSGVPTASGSFVALDISADSEGHAAWRRPIRTYFRRGGEGWTLVGLERLPENLATGQAVKNPTR